MTATIYDYSDDLSDCSNEDDQQRISTICEDLRNSYENAMAFITGILLGHEEGSRTWFAQYLKSAQKRIDSNNITILSQFRAQILIITQKLRIDEVNVNSFDDVESDGDSSQNAELSSDTNSILRDRLILFIATLKFFCALRGIGMLKIDNDESETILNVITAKPPASQMSVKFATVGVCTLLVCSSVINNQKEEKRAADWLKWLIKESNYSDTSYCSHNGCSISELLLLIAIHFQNNQTNQVAELVCATLDMKLQIKASVSKCKSLFVQEVFNEQMIAEHAVKVPVTNGLDDTITEFLPIHCIHQLLESRSFSKHQVPIEHWIYEQICQSRKPIHHMLPKLIEAYVNSVIVCTSAFGQCGTNQPISSESIAKIFETRLYEGAKLESNVKSGTPQENSGSQQKKKKRLKKERSPEPMDTSELSNGRTNHELSVEVIDPEVAQVLFFYYLSLYEDVRLKKSGDLASVDQASLPKYGPEFMINIPVFYLTQLTRDNQDMFGTILPYLIKLVASQYPHLCSIQHWLNTTEHYEPYKSFNRLNELKPPALEHRVQNNCRKSISEHNLVDLQSSLQRQLSDSFTCIDQEPLALIRVISSILHLPRHAIWVFVDIFMDNWHRVLSLSDSYEHRRLKKLITKLWWKFNTIFPRKLWVMTTNSLRRYQTNGNKYSNTQSIDYSWNELTSDPLIVLRCDNRIFRCTPMLGIVLHILNGFLAATKRCLQDQVYEHSNKRTGDNRNLDELRTTLVLAQTSAAIQILLESCIPDESEQEALHKRNKSLDLSEDERARLEKFETSVDCICEHLHQVFIADTNLAKLVHFQTYPGELLSTTSDKIPSMHICLDFIPELLSQPDLSKQVFVIELASHLCEKYAITKSLNVAKLCFNVSFTLLQLLPSDKRAAFYIPVLPALLRICRVFPILLEDAKIILGQINQITLAHMASTSSRLSLNSSQPFEGLDKMSWYDINKLIRSLSLDEALLLSIQKCLLDTCKIVQ